MKKLINLKEILLMMTLATTTLFLVSCNNNQRQQETNISAAKQNNEKFDNQKQKNEAKFLVSAAENNLEQIQLGQLAQQKGSSTHVRELGKTMENEHAKSQKKLKELAKSKNITIPSSLTNDSREVYNDLNSKSGNDFDKAYTSRMVKSHDKTISTYEKASNDSQDMDIKNWASSSLPVLRSHYDRSIDSQSNFDDKNLLKTN